MLAPLAFPAASIVAPNRLDSAGDFKWDGNRVETRKSSNFVAGRVEADVAGGCIYDAGIGACANRARD